MKTGIKGQTLFFCKLRSFWYVVQRNQTISFI